MNRQKGFIVPLAIVIIVVLVMGGGAYIYTQKQKKTEFTSTPQILNNTQGFDNPSSVPNLATECGTAVNKDDCITEVAIDLGNISVCNATQDKVMCQQKFNARATVDVGWKTYSNNKYGFEFKYPSITTVIQQNRDYQPGDIYVLNNIDDTNAEVHVFTAKQYQDWDKKTYSKLISLNKDFSGYKTLTSDTDPNIPTEGDASTIKYIEQKIKINNTPALDIMICGGGDGCGRTVTILKDDTVFEIFHNRGYIKYTSSSKQGATVEVVHPLQRISETTNFDKLLETFTFTK